MNNNFENAGECMGLSLRERERERAINRSTRRKTIDNQSKNKYHIIIRGDNLLPPKPGIEPSPSNIGDKL